MSIKDCWYRDVCSMTESGCSDSCIRFLEMKSLLEKSNLPESKWYPITLSPDKCDYNSFCDLADIKDNIAEFVKRGQNLYLYSEQTGNGKTSWAIKLMLKYFDTIWGGNGFRCRGIFVHTPSILLKLKDFDAIDPKFDVIKSLLPEVDLVIWDDIASTVMSNYDYSQLLMLIDQRVSSCKSNIFTGNLNQAGLEKALGTRLASRVWNTSIHIELRGQDKRKW